MQSAPITREKARKTHHGTVAAALRSVSHGPRLVKGKPKDERTELLATAERNNSLMARLIIAAKQRIECTRQILGSMAQSAAGGGPHPNARFVVGHFAKGLSPPRGTTPDAQATAKETQTARKKSGGRSVCQAMLPVAATRAKIGQGVKDLRQVRQSGPSVNARAVGPSSGIILGAYTPPGHGPDTGSIAPDAAKRAPPG